MTSHDIIGEDRGGSGGGDRVGHKPPSTSNKNLFLSVKIGTGQHQAPPPKKPKILATPMHA